MKYIDLISVYNTLPLKEIDSVFSQVLRLGHRVIDKRTSKLPMIQLQKARTIKWRAVFAESAFIGASILLAFALQDWDEERDIEERTQIALCNVKSELEYNQVLIKRDYIPRQQGLQATVQAAISTSQHSRNGDIPQNNLEQMVVQESLRYSAWTLAGESGYMLHANFELATEIGALVDFQGDSYQPIINRINEAVFDKSREFDDSPMESYIRLSSLIDEWVAQTTFLAQKYDQLFLRDDFINMNCGG